MTDDAGSKKLYQQLARSIADGIKGGVYPRGRRLPSERDLAEKFGVSRPTVREAMIALEIQGFVESRHGSGVYVTHRAPSLDGGADLDIGPFELTEARRAVEGEACALAATSSPMRRSPRWRRPCMTSPTKPRRRLRRGSIRARPNAPTGGFMS